MRVNFVWLAQFLGVILAAGILAACAPPPQVASPETVDDGSVAGNGATDNAEAFTFGPGPFNLADPTVGLSELSGYRSILTISFDGVTEGQPETWTRTRTLIVNADPPGRALTVEGDGEQSGIYVAEVEGVLYRRPPDGTCTAAAITERGENVAPPVLELATQLWPVLGAEDAGAETVNEIAAHHYTFDQRALVTVPAATASGEVWVAEEDGYVVKYLLSLQGGPEYFGEGGEGTIFVEYNLTDAGQPPPLTLPEDCPGSFLDVPVMDDAQAIERLPSLTRYTTPSNVAAVAAYYQEQLPAAGWEVLGKPIVTENLSMLDFVQGEQQLTIIVSAGTDGTVVRLVQGPVLDTQTDSLDFPDIPSIPELPDLP